MENLTREKNKQRRLSFFEDDFCFSTKCILPTCFFLLAFSLMHFHLSIFPKALEYSAFLLFITSCLWDFKGFFVSSVVSAFVLLTAGIDVFSSFSFCIFFLSVVNTSFIVAAFKEMSDTVEKSKKKEFFRLKIWESHYYAFRIQCLEEIESVRAAQNSLSFLEQELEALEKERIEECFEEDSAQRALLDLLSASNQKCVTLQSEVELLEQILLKTSKPIPKKRITKKKKEELNQGLLF
jgi:hypothetical protein